MRNLLKKTGLLTLNVLSSNKAFWVIAVIAFVGLGLMFMNLFYTQGIIDAISNAK